MYVTILLVLNARKSNTLINVFIKRFRNIMHDATANVKRTL